MSNIAPWKVFKSWYVNGVQAIVYENGICEYGNQMFPHQIALLNHLQSLFPDVIGVDESADEDCTVYGFFDRFNGVLYITDVEWAARLVC